MNKNISTFIGCDGDYAPAKIVLCGAPYDSTTSFRPGARFGSNAMRQESQGLETYSPYQDKDLSQCALFDAGDLELPFGNSRKALDIIRDFSAGILQEGKIPCLIGGEHLISLGGIEAAAACHPQLHIVHFDAHMDMRDDYLGERLSHATVMRRAYDLVGPGRIFQLGIRSGDKEEFTWSQNRTYVHKFDLKGLDEILPLLAEKPIYLTLDLDVLDPSVFPGTGTPEAGGVSFTALLEALIKLSSLQIIAFDINELAPIYDASGASTAVACKLLREMLLAYS